MVYGSHRATESAITTGIAWLHNITAQGKLSLYLSDFIYKNCFNEEFYIANLFLNEQFICSILYIMRINTDILIK